MLVNRFTAGNQKSKDSIKEVFEYVFIFSRNIPKIMTRTLMKIFTAGNQKSNANITCVLAYRVNPFKDNSPKAIAREFTKISRAGIQKISNTNKGFFEYMLLFLSFINWCEKEDNI